MQSKSDSIAAELRAHRAKKNVSQSEAASSIGVNAATLGSWEQRAGLSFENAWKLADYYGVSLDELAGRRAS